MRSCGAHMSTTVGDASHYVGVQARMALKPAQTLIRWIPVKGLEYKGLEAKHSQSLAIT